MFVILAQIERMKVIQKFELFLMILHQSDHDLCLLVGKESWKL